MKCEPRRDRRRSYPHPVSARYCAGKTIARCTRFQCAVGQASDMEGEEAMAARNDQRRIGGVSVGGIIVIVGILMLIFWSLWIGLIVILIGLIAFGGFVRGKWY
jgi:hypothetical protein